MELTEGQSGEYLLALPKGTMLFEYRIEAVLGQGGFGITYLATDTLLDEPIALKEFFPSESAVRTRELSARAKSPRDLENFRSGLEAFLGEARIIARFRHPNIMQVRRFFEARGTGYIVLQFERGLSFEDVLAEGALPEPTIRLAFDGILDGLEVIHARAILHRDIKPRNIIIRDDGTPVLIDFGAARDFGARDSRTVTKMASPGYSPPEQYGVGSQQGPWSDFYALGAMMYRAVTGQIPADSLRRLRNDPLVPAAQMAAGSYSAILLAVIDKMMLIDERERPASVGAIRAMFEQPAVNPYRGRQEQQVSAGRPDAGHGKLTPHIETLNQGSASQASARWSRIAVSSMAGAVLVTALSIGAYTYSRLMPVDRFTIGGKGGTSTTTGSEAPSQVAATVPPRGGSPIPSDEQQPQQSPQAAFEPGTFFQDCSTCPKLAVIAPGTFRMGSENGFRTEKPVHEVRIASRFAIGLYLVTFAEWNACVAASGCKRRPDDHEWGRAERPVIDVSWDDANAYVDWLSATTLKKYRLPSEAEWEYAARAGTKTAYWWGDDVGAGHANCSDCLVPRPAETKPVGSFAPNAFGLYDMAGNAAEWVSDCWKDSYQDAPADGSSMARGECGERVLRGGSFRSDARYLRSAARTRSAVNLISYSNGFRVVRER